MKAISIGYSTEDGELFFDQYDDMVEGLKKVGYYNGFVYQHEVEKLEDKSAVQDRLAQMLADDLQRFGTDADKAEWNQNVAKFFEAIEGKAGTFVSWSLEYDDNLMFVFDATEADIEALKEDPAADDQQ